MAQLNLLSATKMHLSLFVHIAGFIIGLGAVTVIDLHGFLGQKSGYWTRATIATHKITKPLIWLGTGLLMIGAWLNFRNQNPFQDPLILTQILLFLPMILNGIFLSFYVSPILLKRESQNKANEILPASLQSKIFVSFIISFICWWGELFLFTKYLAKIIS